MKHFKVIPKGPDNKGRVRWGIWDAQLQEWRHGTFRNAAAAARRAARYWDDYLYHWWA